MLHTTGTHNYYVYIVTNKAKTVLYIGFTNELKDRAIGIETQLKKWRREKKDALINEFNPEWRFLNDEILD